jgi:hypothetical protein
MYKLQEILCEQGEPDTNGFCICISTNYYTSGLLVDGRWCGKNIKAAPLTPSNYPEIHAHSFTVM